MSGIFGRNCLLLPLSNAFYGERLAGLQRIAREEGNKIRIKITRPDLPGCLHPVYDIAEDEASRSRRSENFTGALDATKNKKLLHVTSDNCRASVSFQPFIQSRKLKKL